MSFIRTVLLLFFLLLISVFSSRAQETHPERVGVNMESMWEELIEEYSEEDYNWENEIEELYETIREPLNLNTATKEQLEQFPFLTDLQIENLLAYVYIYGPMQTIYELQLVEEMDKQTIDYLLPFVMVGPVKEKSPLPPVKKILMYGRNQILTRVDIPFYQRKGYEKNYLGPSLYHSLRYTFRYKKLVYAGITAEKDAGEPLFALHNQKGYDHYSFYFYLQNIKKLKALAVGNYRVSFGQGLVISNDFMLGKTTTMSSMIRRRNQIKKHSSTDEYNYLRGVAGSVKLNRFLVSGFYSHRRLDGIVTDQSITSIQKTGLHRTKKEADRRETFAMQLAGGNVQYLDERIKLGLTGTYYFFDRPYKPQLREYAKYNLQGNYFYNVGLSYRYRWQRLTLVGETAIDKQGNPATLNTLHYSYRQKYKVVLLHRYYAYNYWNMFARSFSEGGYVQNENGWYAALESHNFRYWQFFLSADFFSFPWKKYLVDAPSSGYELSSKITFAPRENFTMFLRYRFKKKDKNYTDKNKVKSIRPLYTHRWRYQLNYTHAEHISFRSVIDYNRVYPQGVPASQGFQFIQVASYTFLRFPLKLEAQLTLFQTDDYASRTYGYEKGLLYTFYTPSFYGKGCRLSAFVRYDLNRNWMFIAKYGHTAYSDREEIGSGNDLIASNRKCDLQLQVRMKF